MIPEPALDAASILLVDDMEDNLTALEAVLDPLNQKLVRASSGPDAMKAMLRQEFAVILLDVLMPGMDGFETAANIKRLDQTKEVPIIFLTGANTDRSYAFRGYATGAVDYLTKPFDPWVLRAKVSVFLELNRSKRQLQALLSRDLHQLDDVSERLARIENELASNANDEAAGLWHHVARMGEAISEMRQLLTPRYSTDTIAENEIITRTPNHTAMGANAPR
ncbi:response regulator [Streptomyces sp. NPDC055709]